MGSTSEPIEMLTELGTVLEADRDTDTHLLARVYNLLGTAYYFASEMLTAHNHYSRAYQISLQFAESDILSAQITYNLGHICHWLRRDAEAIQYFENASSLYEKVSDPRKMADALYMLGHSYLNAKKFAEAEEILKQSRSLYESLNVLEMCQLVKRHYAFFILSKTDPKKAIDTLIESTNHLHEVGDTLALAYTHANISLLYMGENDTSNASHHLAAALDKIKDERNHKDPKVPYIYRVEAQYHLKIKELHKSIESAFKSSELFGKMGLEKERASSLEVAVDAYKGLGNIHAALEVSERVTKILNDAFPVNPIY